MSQAHHLAGDDNGDPIRVVAKGIVTDRQEQLR